MVLSNDAKHNKNGNLEYMAFGPHADPMLDTSSMHGLLWMYRFVEQKEPLPPFPDYKRLYKYPTYPAFRNRKKGMAPTSYSSMWKMFFDDMSIVVSKLTHQFRRQSMQEADDKRIDPEHISRQSGHHIATLRHSVEQLLSYFTNPPITMVCHGAGGDHRNPRSHCPVLAAAPKAEYVLKLLLPELFDALETLRQEFKDTPTFEERELNRLYTRHQCCLSIIHDLYSFLAFLATRPVDPVTLLLQKEQPTWFEQFRHKRFRSLFRHSAFQSREWLEYTEIIRKIEDQKHQHRMQLDMADERDRSLALFQNHMLNSIHALHTQMNQLQQILSAMKPWSQSSPGPCSTAMAAFAESPANSTTTSVEISNKIDAGLVMPTPALGPVTHDCNGKKRKRAISQEETARLDCLLQQGVLGCPNGSGTIPRPILKDSDAHCKTFSDHLDLYKTKWKALEDQYGSSWRVDLPYRDVHGKSMKTTARATWWGHRSPMFLLWEGLLHHSTPEEALSICNQIFNSVPPGTEGKRNIKKIGAAFRKEIKRRGFSKGVGRPKGAKTSHSAKAIRQAWQKSNCHQVTTPPEMPDATPPLQTKHPRVPHLQKKTHRTPMSAPLYPSNRSPSDHNAAFETAFRHISQVDVGELERRRLSFLSPEQLREHQQLLAETNQAKRIAESRRRHEEHWTDLRDNHGWDYTHGLYIRRGEQPGQIQFPYALSRGNMQPNVPEYQDL